MEPAEFLRRHPPFDQLRPEEFRAAVDGLEVAYVARGESVMRRGGPPATHLWIVRKGSVRLEREGQLVQVLEEGDAFGFPSLIGRASPHVDVVAAEDVLAYRLPARVFDQLMESPAFSEFFLVDLAARLKRAASVEALPMGVDLAQPALELATREPVWLPSGSRVGDAARRMRELGVSSVLVRGEPMGILTDRDLRSRVLAEGLGPDTPADDVKSRPLVTLDAGASLFEVLLLMLERRVHHVPLVREGRVVGVLTDTDLLRAQVRSPIALLKRLAGDGAHRDRAAYGSELAHMVEALFGAGLEAVQIGRVVSRLNDALVASLLRAAEGELGAPPAPYAWIVFGSEGRMEQTLLTDQDNAIVHADVSAAEAAYFPRLAERVVSGLLEAGFPACPGGFMATAWCHSLPAWRDRFRDWIHRPDPQALLDASSLFDWRAVHGSLDLASLDAVIRGASEQMVFLAHLARTALAFEPPISAFRHIRDEHGGVDLKKGGLLPIVGLARVAALEAASGARSTLDRLDAAAEAGTLSREGAATLAEALRFLLRLRLRDQLRARRAGRPVGNAARLEGLTPLERAQLKDVFLAVREMQSALRLRYHTERLG